MTTSIFPDDFPPLIPIAQTKIMAANGNTNGYITVGDIMGGSLGGTLTVVGGATTTSELINDSGFITSASVPTALSQLTNNTNFITASGAPVQIVNGQTGTVTISIPTATHQLINDSGFLTGYTLTSTAIDAALGYTPYNSTNPSGFITGTTITSTMVTSALTFTPYNSTNPSGFITASSLPTAVSQLANDRGYITGTTITSAQVDAALGFTPYNSTNPASYITSAQAPVQSVNGQTGTVSLTLITALGSLTDVLVTGMTTGQVLEYDSSVGKWKNVTLAYSLIGGVPSLISSFTNNVGYITGTTITSAQVDAALGFTPISGTTITNAMVNSVLGNQTLTVVGDSAGSGIIVNNAGTVTITLASVGTPGTFGNIVVDSKGRLTYARSINSLDVTTALGFTPISGTTITGSMVTSALTFTPYNQTNPAGYITNSISGSFTAATLVGVHVGSLLGTATYALSSGYTPSLTGTISSSQVTGLMNQGTVIGYATIAGSALALTGTITSSQVTGLLNQGTVIGYATIAGSALALTGTIPYSQVSSQPTIPSTTGQLTNNSGYITSISTSMVDAAIANSTISGNITASNLIAQNNIVVSNNLSCLATINGVLASISNIFGVTGSFSGTVQAATLVGSLSTAQVNNAIGFTPYNNTNPSGYITGTTITGSMVTGALTFTPYNQTNPSLYITSSQAPVQSVNGMTGAVSITTAQTGQIQMSIASLAGYLPLSTPGNILTYSAAMAPALAAICGTSTTGTFTNNYAMFPGTSNIYGIAYGNSVFVAVGYNTSGCAGTSTDGFNYTQRTMPANVQWSAVAWSSSLSLFAAVGGTTPPNYVATSPDGITWTQRSIPSNVQYSSICWGGSLFVAVGGTVSMTSPNGITWTQRTIPGSYNNFISWGNSMFVMLQGGINGTLSSSSPDGITWTQRTLPANLIWNSVAWGGSLFVAVGQGFASGTTIAATSSNGITWVAQTLSHSAQWSSISWNGSIFCAVANDSNFAITSTNGTNWGDTFPLYDYSRISCNNGSIFAMINTWAQNFSQNGNTTFTTPTFTGTLAISGANYYVKI